LDELQVAAYGMFPLEQVGLKAAFEDRFYKFMERNADLDDETRVNLFAYPFLPLRCEAKASARLKNFVTSSAKLHPVLKRSFLAGIEEDERCQRIRNSR
jgi:hypothetical protein